MSLPRAVLEAEKRADEILKQLNQAASPQSQDGEVEAKDPAPKEEQAQSDAAPAVPSTTENPEEAPAAQEDPTWESRYRSLIGKYN